MDPARKRTIRLTVALAAAVVLASALVYTSFSASSEAKTPSELVASAQAGSSYQLTGKVVPGTTVRSGDRTRFRVQDRNGGASVRVDYRGAVPDAFRDGREIIVTVKKRGATFVGEHDSLITKCPSKYSDKQPA